MERSRLAPAVQEALANIGRTIPRLGLKPNDEKKVKGIRKKRRRRGVPKVNLDMVPEGATPAEARRIELAQRRERQRERGLRQPRPVPQPRKKPTSTDANKVKAAHLRRERRNQRRFRESANGGWKR